MLQVKRPYGKRGAIVVSRATAPLHDTSLNDTMELDKAPPGPSSVPVGQRAEMWAYLEPLLAKHKGEKMPHGGYVWELSILPRVRDLDANFVWQRGHPYTDTTPRDVSAVIIQLTGEPAATPCNKCKEGKGPWNGCIMISSKAADHAVANIVSCANCFYHYGQTYCSHKSWGAERSQRILRSRGKGNIQPWSTKVPSLRQGERLIQDATPGLERQSLPPANEPTKPSVLTEDQKALWSYIMPQLAFTTEVPEVGYIKELLSLPRVRDLGPLNEPVKERHTRDIASLILQVTGDELESPCTNCRRGQGPFRGGCVAISTQAHPEARRVYQACANCTYNSKGGACSKNRGIPQRPQPPFPPKVTGIIKSSDGIWLGTRGGGPRHSTAPRPHRQAALAAASCIAGGNVQSENHLSTVEEWEMAPGRLLKSNTDKPISK